jgi:hypothetical protein
VPVAVTAGDKIEALRQWASGRCLSADQPGIYSRASGAGGNSRIHRVMREPRDHAEVDGGVDGQWQESTEQEGPCMRSPKRSRHDVVNPSSVDLKPPMKASSDPGPFFSVCPFASRTSATVGSMSCAYSAGVYTSTT